jgi:hypothetical protein
MLFDEQSISGHRLLPAGARARPGAEGVSRCVGPTHARERRVKAQRLPCRPSDRPAAGSDASKPGAFFGQFFGSEITAVEPSLSAPVANRTPRALRSSKKTNKARPLSVATSLVRFRVQSSRTLHIVKNEYASHINRAEFFNDFSLARARQCPFGDRTQSTIPIS